MKAAFATQDCTRIDAHFGWARHMVIYDIQPDGYHYLRTVSFNGPLTADGKDRKLTAKFKAVRGCALVFASAIGDRAAAQLVRHDAQAVLGYSGKPIVAALEELQDALRHRPCGWVRKQLQRDRGAER